MKTTEKLKLIAVFAVISIIVYYQLTNFGKIGKLEKSIHSYEYKIGELQHEQGLIMEGLLQHVGTPYVVTNLGATINRNVKK